MGFSDVLLGLGLMVMGAAAGDWLFRALGWRRVSLSGDQHWTWCARCPECNDGFRWPYEAWVPAKDAGGDDRCCRTCGAAGSFERAIGRRSGTGWEWHDQVRDNGEDSAHD